MINTVLRSSSSPLILYSNATVSTSLLRRTDFASFRQLSTMPYGSCISTRQHYTSLIPNASALICCVNYSSITPHSRVHSRLMFAVPWPKFSSLWGSLCARRALHSLRSQHQSFPQSPCVPSANTTHFVQRSTRTILLFRTVCDFLYCLDYHI